MRQLLYVPVIHSVDDSVRVGESDERTRGIDEIHEALVGYNAMIVKYITEVVPNYLHIHQAYLEGVTQEDIKLLPSAKIEPYKFPWLVTTLARTGMKVVPTEYDGLMEIHQALLEHEATLSAELSLAPDYEFRPVPMEMALSDYKRNLPRDLYDVLEELTKGQKFLDMVWIRDKHIARTIDDTLPSDQNALLLIGNAHQVGQHLLANNSGIKVFYKDPSAMAKELETGNTIGLQV